jgi:hypothetical protein
MNGSGGSRARVVRIEKVPEPFSGRLSGVRFTPPSEGINFDGATFEDVDFSGLTVDRVFIRGCTFVRCDFSRSVLRVGGLSVPPPSVYLDCRFNGSDLRQVNPGYGRFERCSFERTRIDGWLSWSAWFVDCRFVGRIQGAEFWGSAPDYETSRESGSPAFPDPPNEFRGNDFRAADLQDVEFLGGIDLDAQLLPQDPAYVRLDIRPETLDRVEAYVRRLPEAERGDWRGGRMAVLGSLRARYQGQHELFTKQAPRGGFAQYARLLEQALGEQA